MAGNVAKQDVTHRKILDMLIFFKNCILRIGKYSVKTANNCQRKYDLTVFMRLVHAC